MFKTEICELLDIEIPLIQGGMAWVSYAELAGAVSNGGGLGIIASGMLNAESLKQEIAKAKMITDRPFGVNVMMLRQDCDDIFQAILDDPVAVVTTGAGNPGKFIPELKKKGIKVLPVVASTALAQRMERAGADGVIAEGMEAGGHIGEITSMCLIPEVVDAVRVPVIAAGGIIDGRGVAAAFMLGAKAVQMGTRFLCAEETTINRNVKERVLAAKDRDTTITGRSTGHPVRVMKNKLSKELEKLDIQNKPDELISLGSNKLQLAMREGDVEWGSLMCGQGAALVQKIQPAAEIIREVMDDAVKTIKAAHGLVGDIVIDVG